MSMNKYYTLEEVNKIDINEFRNVIIYNINKNNKHNKNINNNICQMTSKLLKFQIRGTYDEILKYIKKNEGQDKDNDHRQLEFTNELISNIFNNKDYKLSHKFIILKYLYEFIAYGDDEKDNNEEIQNFYVYNLPYYYKCKYYLNSDKIKLINFDINDFEKFKDLNFYFTFNIKMCFTIDNDISFVIKSIYMYTDHKQVININYSKHELKQYEYDIKYLNINELLTNSIKLKTDFKQIDKKLDYNKEKKINMIKDYNN